MCPPFPLNVYKIRVQLKKKMQKKKKLQKKTRSSYPLFKFPRFPRRSYILQTKLTLFHSIIWVAQWIYIHSMRRDPTDRMSPHLLSNSAYKLNYRPICLHFMKIMSYIRGAAVVWCAVARSWHTRRARRLARRPPGPRRRDCRPSDNKNGAFIFLLFRTYY